MQTTLPPAPRAADLTTAVEVWTAIGTVSGAVFTAGAVGVALLISHRDWRRAEDDRRDREMAQARLIVVAPPGGGGNRHIALSVTNWSTAPVFEVVVDFVVHYEDPALRGLPVGGTPETVLVLPAGAHHVYSVQIVDPDGNPVVATATSPIHVPVRRELSVTFLDAAGLKWRRAWPGQPQRVVEPGAASLRRWWVPWRR